MKEILFRGKRVDNGKWVYGYYVELVDNEEHFYWINKPNGDMIDIIPETVGQYTGLKDRDGIKIYEGDVLFHPLQGRRKVFYPYSETVASYGLRDIDNGLGSTLQDSHAVWEVIGNIHDNPELIGVKK